MTATANSLHPNFMAEKKSVDLIHKDVKKWVDSVVKFKASLEKKKEEAPLEKHLKKVKKFKLKKKLASIPTLGGDSKNSNPVSHAKQQNKSKKIRQSEKSPAKISNASTDKFDEIKESYRTIRLPPSWTSGVSGGRIVFNRVKVSTHNSQQKMTVERSLVITKDCNTHVLIDGSEIVLNNWEMQKVATLEDVRKAIKDIEALKICEGSPTGAKSPQCFVFVDNVNKTCPACKSETISPPKQDGKKHSTVKKSAPIKRKVLSKQKSPI